MADVILPVLPDFKHPKADPDCASCSGHGWFVSDRRGGVPEFDGKQAVERCDECLYHGTDSPDTVWDDDIAMMLRARGAEVRINYPCVLLTEYTFEER